ILRTGEAGDPFRRGESVRGAAGVAHGRASTSGPSPSANPVSASEGVLGEVSIGTRVRRAAGPAPEAFSGVFVFIAGPKSTEGKEGGTSRRPRRHHKRKGGGDSCVLGSRGVSEARRCRWPRPAGACRRLHPRRLHSRRLHSRRFQSRRLHFAWLSFS